MKIRLNKIIGIIMLVIGSINVLFFLLIMVGSGEIDYTNLLLSFFIILLAIGYIRGSYFEISGNKLILLNLIGKNSHEFPFADKSVFEVKGKNVIFTDENNHKLKLYKFTSNQSDWAAFLAWLNE